MNKFFADVKIGKRLLIGFGILAILLLGISGFALWGNNIINQAMDGATAEYQAMERAYEMGGSIDTLYLSVAEISISQDVAEINALQAEVETLRTSYKEHLSELKTLASTEAELQLLKNIEDAVTLAATANNEVISLALAGKRDEAQAAYVEKSIPEMDKTDQAVIEIVASQQQQIDEADKAAEGWVVTLRIWLIAIAVFALAVAILLSVFTTRSITSTLTDCVTFTGQLAQGDFSQDPPEVFRKRGDEMGDLARAFHAMVGNVRTLLGSITGGVQTVASSSTELSSVSHQMSSTAADTSTKANVVAAAAEEMSANTISVAAGMEEATTNLRSVATATEEMTATIGEIAGNSEKARRITGQAVTQADQISVAVRELGKSAQEIGKVTETITSISNQTNLLALNATIEAARAGAAGKGFAVVATEIKELAQQTAAATEDIKDKIAGVQNSTASAVSDIEKITGVIREVSDIVSSIATAIEEQSVVTRDIASNISQAMLGVKDANERVAQTAAVSQEIARDITGVSNAGQDMSNGSSEVNTSAVELSKLSENLNAMVAQFKI